jgi:type 1 glutamine amidotransferase
MKRPWHAAVLTCAAAAAVLGAFVLIRAVAAAEPARPRKVVLIAGPKSHGPVGNGVHDYGWSVRLLKGMLDRSNVKDRLKVETHLDGWPADPKATEDADTIVVISDGRDGDQYREAEHLASPERVAQVDRLMKRGCGLVTIHFSNFAPDKYADQVLDWTGGFFDWEADGKRQWYSAITTLNDAEVKLAAPQHPVSRGVRPSFRMKEEFYYNLRFNPAAGAVTPLLMVPELKGREPDGRVVAWARERTAGGGRGFGTTCGHFYDNWRNDDFRRLVLNAIVWTAHAEVPEGGVESTSLTHDQIEVGERESR